MKNFLLASLLLSLFVGCCSVSRGVVNDNYDTFKHTRIQSVTLGELASNNSSVGAFLGAPMAFRVAGGFSKEQADQQPSKYYLNVNVSSVALQVPAQVRKDSLIIFLVDGKTYECSIENLQSMPIHGGVLECCKIGPLPESMIVSIREGKEIKCKIYGICREIEVAIDGAAVVEMNKLIELG